MVVGTGHAEANIIAHARVSNLHVLDIGATRSICGACQILIRQTSANISTPLAP
jgi:filamentous hemagglutinin